MTGGGGVGRGQLRPRVVAHDHLPTGNGSGAREAKADGIGQGGQVFGGRETEASHDDYHIAHGQGETSGAQGR